MSNSQRSKKLTLEEFLTRVEKLYHNRFNFSKVNYVNNKTPVCLIDKDFGNLDFWVVPLDLLKGRALRHPLETFKEFVYLAELAHPNEFDFSITEESFNKISSGRSRKITTKTEACVFAIHKASGEIYNKSINWFVTPSENNKTYVKKFSNLSREEFIEESIKLYDKKFDYSKVKWKNCNVLVELICNDCNSSVFVTPRKHLKGNTICNNCEELIKKEKREDAKNLTQKNFIEKLVSLYGDKFDYSYVNYLNNHTKVKILCRSHNQFFEEFPRNLLRGKTIGCDLCKEEKRIEDAKNFIESAKEIHGELYDYSLVIDTYKNMTTKIEIICNNILNLNNAFFNEKGLENKLYVIIVENILCKLLLIILI